MGWATFSESDQDWDQLLQKLNSSSPFSLSNWSRYKHGTRWTSLKAIRIENGAYTSAALVLWFRLLRIVTIAWVPGGIAGDDACESKELLQLISTASGTRATYCRIALRSRTNDLAERDLVSRGWSRAARFIGAHETFVLHRSEHGLSDKSKLSSNWSRNLERGLKRGVTCEAWAKPNAEEIHQLMEQMTDFKRTLGPQVVPSTESIAQLLSSMGDRMVTVHTRNEQGSLVAMRAAFVNGPYAWDALAAANSEARKIYASYVCAWKLIEVLNEMGVNEFDLAGIDPKENEGVFNFKKGLGGHRHTYLGEWETSQPSMIKHLLGRVVSRMG